MSVHIWRTQSLIIRFKSTKPPVPENSTAVKSDKQKQEESLTEDHAAEAMNLKHDLELQQLLRESHLLEKSSGSALTHTHRQKAIDMRIQALGAKSSIFTQTNMPVSHRRGIMAKANQREKARRKEAKENSIVLEREVKTKGSRAARRERGIGAPTVGKFKGGTLRLSRRDIGDIQGRSKGGSVPRKRRK